MADRPHALRTTHVLAKMRCGERDNLGAWRALRLDVCVLHLGALSGAFVPTSYLYGGCFQVLDQVPWVAATHLGTRRGAEGKGDTYGQDEEARASVRVAHIQSCLNASNALALGCRASGFGIWVPWALRRTLVHNAELRARARHLRAG